MKREIVRRAGLLLLMSLLCVSGAAVRAEAQSEPAGQSESAVQELSEIQREIYIPKELAHNDFSDESAEWSFARSKESEHFVLFWQAGFGDDPGSEDIPSWMRVNTDDFEEGVAFFEGQGYSIFGEAHETDSSITALLTKGDGTYMVLFQHKK